MLMFPLLWIGIRSLFGMLLVWLAIFAYQRVFPPHRFRIYVFIPHHRLDVTKDWIIRVTQAGKCVHQGNESSREFIRGMTRTDETLPRMKKNQRFLSGMVKCRILKTLTILLSKMLVNGVGSSTFVWVLVDCYRYPNVSICRARII